jgi:putative membrane-bound dehydrogenase-like protein
VLVWSILAGLILVTGWSCQSAESVGEPLAPDISITLDSAQAAADAQRIRQEVAAQVYPGLELSLWASDTLAPDPIAIRADEQGRIYLTNNERIKNSEFDIRGHMDWATESISWTTVADRRAFLRREFAPERSEENDWLADLNEDGSHDWRDLTVESDNVFRIEDRDGDGIADYSRLFSKVPTDEVTDPAGGVQPFQDAVYVAAAPHLWRLRDRDGDGIADEKTSLSEGYMVHIGFGGHGMSGLTYGPDGRIYWGIGDIGANVTAPDGTQWSYPNQGFIARANPDGSDFEVFAAGLRNTHEFVFDDYGNLISVDNDGDHPGESERLVYLVNGSDSGWRTNWQYGKYTDPDNNDYKVWMDEGLSIPRHPDQAAYIIPPIRNYHNGPAGMLYHPGTALNDDFRGHFFVTEFTGSPARANIYAFRLRPDGAGFAFRDEKLILNGVLATGMDWGPEGALYVADWIDGWGANSQGRIWKIDDPAQADSPLRREVAELIGADFAPKTPEELEALLGHADRRVRLKAQFALSERGADGAAAFERAIAASQEQLVRVHGIWGLAQLARLEDAAYAERLLPLLRDSDPEIRAQAARWLGDVRYAAAGPDLLPLLTDSVRVRFFAAEALGRIAHEPAIPDLIEVLRENDDRDVYLRHAASLALARIGASAPLAALADNPSRAVRTGAVLALRRMQDPAVAAFLNDADEYVATEAARAINDDGGIEAALPDLARVLADTKFSGEPLIRRAINANLRVGAPENLTLLTAYAENTAAPAELRAEAVAALGTWSQPSVTDRVDGFYHGPVEREAGPAKQALDPIVRELLAGNDPTLQAAAAQAAGKLGLTATEATLVDLVRSGSNAVVRLAALRALSDMQAGGRIAALKLALQDEEEDVRVGALRLLPEQDLPAQELLETFEIVLAKASIREQQAALSGLGELPAAATGPLLQRLLDELAAGTLPPALELELSQAVAASADSVLAEQLADFHASLDQSDPLTPYREAIEGGNWWRGRRLFQRHEAAQCARCHSLEVGVGSDVGPVLAGIGDRYDRAELLRSLVAPSQRLAPGYGTVVLSLKDGRQLSGILIEEDTEAIYVRSGDA